MHLRQVCDLCDFHNVTSEMIYFNGGTMSTFTLTESMTCVFLFAHTGKGHLILSHTHLVLSV